MGHYLPTSRIKKRVDDVISEVRFKLRDQMLTLKCSQLGLDGCRKTIIGTEKKSKISGGQKKRLSFASEVRASQSLLAN